MDLRTIAHSIKNGKWAIFPGGDNGWEEEWKWGRRSLRTTDLTDFWIHVGAV